MWMCVQMKIIPLIKYCFKTIRILNMYNNNDTINRVYGLEFFQIDKKSVSLSN